MSETTKEILNFLYIPFIALMHFIAIDKMTFTIYAGLLAIDLLTGVGKVIRLGHKPTSKRFLIGIMAKLTFLLVPIIVALGAKGIGLDLTSLVNTVIYALILNEVYSSIANIYTIQTGIEAEEFDVLSKILKVLRDLIERILNDKKIP
jgi:hypothetical protein